MKRLIILAASLVTPFLNAQSTSTTVECKKSTITRNIEVKKSMNGTAQSCEVIYHKPTETGQSNIIWSADQQANYCDQKAIGFVQKQESWGFTCTGQDALNQEASMQGDSEQNTATMNTAKDSASDTAVENNVKSNLDNKIKNTTKTLEENAPTGTTNPADMIQNKSTTTIKEKMNDTTKSMMDKAKEKASQAIGKTGGSMMEKGKDAMNKVLSK